jgi:hypothetical protein
MSSFELLTAVEPEGAPEASQVIERKVPATK